MLETDARSGSRYIELLRGHFGVISPDGRLQRPELLSANRTRINVHQIVQQSESNTTPLGTTAAMSLTSNTDNSFVKSFTEHGFVIGVMCARYNHTYQQGLQRMWSRKNRLDYYFPILANIGEQPIYSREIYYDNDGFGSLDDVRLQTEADVQSRYNELRQLDEAMRAYDVALMTNTLDLLKDAVTEGQISVIDYYTEADNVYNKLMAYYEVENRYQKLLAEIYKNRL